MEKNTVTEKSKLDSLEQWKAEKAAKKEKKKDKEKVENNFSVRKNVAFNDKPVQNKPTHRVSPRGS
jgi:hypothetical protein